MNEANKSNDPNGTHRLLNARVLMTLVMVLTVVLAGCTGFGGIGGGDDGSSGDSTSASSGNAAGSDSTSVESADTDGSGGANDGGADGDNTDGGGADGGNTDGGGADGGNADGGGADGGNADGGGADASQNTGDSGASDDDSGNSANVLVPLAEDPEDTEQWFNLSEPGRYAFEIETAGKGTGEMTFETTPASDGQVSIDTHYELGGESSDSSVTAPVGEAQGQLITSPGFQYLFLLSLSGIGLAASLGGQDLEVGNQIQRNNADGSYSVKVTDKRNYGGVECYFIETRTNGTLTNEVCTQGAFQSAPYVATYNETGLKQRIELTEYKRG